MSIIYIYTHTHYITLRIFRIFEFPTVVRCKIKKGTKCHREITNRFENNKSRNKKNYRFKTEVKKAVF